MRVYVHECYSCGRVRSQLARLRAQGVVEIIDSRVSKDLETEHLEILKSAGLDSGHYQPVVVDGKDVRLLREV